VSASLSAEAFLASCEGEGSPEEGVGAESEGVVSPEAGGSPKGGVGGESEGEVDSAVDEEGVAVVAGTWPSAGPLKKKIVELTTVQEKRRPGPKTEDKDVFLVPIT